MWFDDALPLGATGTTNGDTWNWTGANPAPQSGSKAHKSDAKSGLHEHAFNWATPLTPAAGDTLYTWVYIDPASVPSEIMLSWVSANWEHRAYWGANKIQYGTDKTASRYYMGALPAAGQWVRLDVPAKLVELEGAPIVGMGFSLFDGGATFDSTGLLSAAAAASGSTVASNGTPAITVAATDATAVIGSASDNAQLTFTRSGSTASELVVNFKLGGTAVKWIDYRRPEGDMPETVTIPAGQTAVTMNIRAVDNVNKASDLYATVTLAAGTGYDIGTANTAKLTFAAASSSSSSSPTTASSGTTTTPTESSTSSTSSASSSSSTSSNASGSLVVTPTTDTATTPVVSAAESADKVWFDDALPAGAGGGASGGDTWSWVGSNPAPYSGTVAHQSALASGLHEHFFNWAGATLSVAAGEKLFAYVYIDPANKPTELMLSWCTDNWEHRAYWGADQIGYGTKGTAGRYYAGALPEAGKWIRLEVPASAVGLEGATVRGMAFTLFGGRATWDKTGKSALASGTTPSPSSGSGTTPTTPSTIPDFVWIDDSLPGGAGASANNDTWNWIAASPAPYAGSKAFQTTAKSGLHELSFNWAGTTMNVATGEVLFAYVYIDPANIPSEIMINWCADNWEHRAYWGANKINYGTNNTAGRYYAGALPAAGGWVRLEVPASAVGLAGKNVVGMSFSLFDGRAAFDKIGKGGALVAGTPSTPSTPSDGSGTPTTPPPATLPAVTVAATDATATIASPTDTAQLTFTRSGATTSALLVKFNLGGTAVKWIDYRRPEGDMPVEITIPAGAASATLNLLAIANTNNANPATATFTLASDAAYTIGSANTATVTLAAASSTPTTPPVVTNPPPVVTNPPPVVTNPPPTTTPTDPGTTPTTPIVSSDENAVARLPIVGEHRLRILTPTLIELDRVTTKDPDPAPAKEWNWVDGSGNFSAPAKSEFQITVAGKAANISAMGFRRRVAYAPLNQRDLRIDNALYLQLDTAIADGATVEVKNSSGALWPSSFSYVAKAEALRYNPAIHTNQEGYVPSLAKKAMVGYWMGSLGELNIDASKGFSIVNARTGASVYTGTLALRKETGYAYAPLPYQKVYEADFTPVTTPGEYQLVVPGMGASLPFLINDGVAMMFTRTYAAGLFHQRCGFALNLPFTRFTHDACHMLAAEIPSPQSSYNFTWTTIASKNSDAKSDPRHTAPQLKDEASQLYPFVNKGKVDVSGGHHDAGDYSKYTINVAALTHLLMFTADSIGGASALDNLGLPESGDGKSDIMQEAKQEADYLAKLQDADGGFYFIVYPKNREYESDVSPDKGDQQVVWPKNTSATAAAVAALAQAASSPKFKAAYPAEAAAYLAKAKLGWQFLTNAIAKYGKDGSYQKVTFYGNNYLHDDELAWAACEMFLATGEQQYHAKLKEWFPNPSDPATFRWGWWRLSESWGNAIRSYAFAARSGRLPAASLDAAYLAKCEEQVKLAGDDALAWSNSSAYGTAFPVETRHAMAAGWFFSLDQASDMAVAYQLNPKPEYLTALVGNMNYEAGSNPINVTFVTGVGLKRQHEVVSQWANNNRQVLPVTGMPTGNVQSNFDWLSNYGASGNELTKLTYPTDTNNAPNMYPFYDRWTDTWNVTTEFITVNQARSLMSVVALAAQTSAKSTAWKPSATASIVVPAVVPVGTPTTLSLTTSGLDLAGARIVWEARDNEPDFGSTYSVTPKNNGAQWAEAEIVWPDGRRVFATASFTADSPVITWVDDAMPAGAWNSGGTEGWNWVTSGPAPKSGTKAHQSATGPGLHEHSFNDAGATLTVKTGDTLFCWVYIDPSNTPTEIMLHWNDGTWDHRAYWGANNIQYGNDKTASRYYMGALPAAGQWVKLVVPASAVGLEGRDVKGMSFSTYGGRATWDAAGKASAGN